MCGAHGMARHRRQSPEGGTPHRFFPPKRGMSRPAFPSEQGPPRRIFPLRRIFPPQQGRPLLAGRGRAFALRSIFSKKNTAFC